jgi:predicted N-acetyltransferase YhbS
MFSITPERHQDADAIELLLDQSFGPAWRLKPSSQFRIGAPPLPGLDLVARSGDTIIGSVRYSRVRIGAGQPALMLGPLAVASAHRDLGIGTALMWQSLDLAAWANHRIVLLTGDTDFHDRFGFSAAMDRGIFLPGFENRLLVKEIDRGALDHASGRVVPWGWVRLARKAA